MGIQTTTSGTLYSQTPSLNRESRGITIEWPGSRQFVTSLFPYISGDPPEIKPLGGGSGRIGDTDWISAGDPEVRITAGPLSHVSDLTVLRDRGKNFPAVLVISGIEFHFGPYSFTGNKPLTASLDGLEGIWLTSRPDTLVEIHSPDILPGDSFILDDRTVIADKSGELEFQLQKPGEHSFRRTQ